MDLQLYETLNGGDLNFSDGDIQTTGAYWVQIYLSLFGGAIEQSENEFSGSSGDERAYYWGNDLFADTPLNKMNSITERTLKRTILNSAGRVAIEDAVKEDISKIEGITDPQITVSIIGNDSIQIDILFAEPETFSSEGVRFLWEETNKSTIDSGTGSGTGGGTVVSVWLLSNDVWTDSGKWIDSETWKK